jgi:hypothetical protein
MHICRRERRRDEPAESKVVAPDLVCRRWDGGSGRCNADKGGGYQLSEHVKRYYKTTLV